MNNKKIKLIVSILVAFILLIPAKKYFQEPRDIQVKIELKQSKNMNLQIFYTQNLKVNFNEKDSVILKIPAEKNRFKTVEINLKNIEVLEKLRIDLGEAPEKVLIKKIEILGVKDINIPMEKLITYPMNQIESKKLNNGVLELDSNLVDPFIILDSKAINNSKGVILNYPKALVAFLILFFGVYFIIGIIQKNKKND